MMIPRPKNSVPTMASHDSTDNCPPIQTGKLVESLWGWEQLLFYIRREEIVISTSDATKRDRLIVSHNVIDVVFWSGIPSHVVAVDSDVWTSSISTNSSSWKVSVKQFREWAWDLKVSTPVENSLCDGGGVYPYPIRLGMWCFDVG